MVYQQQTYLILLDTFEKTRNLLLKNNLHIVNFQKHDYKELKNKFKNL